MMELCDNVMRVGSANTVTKHARKTSTIHSVAMRPITEMSPLFVPGETCFFIVNYLLHQKRYVSQSKFTA